MLKRREVVFGLSATATLALAGCAPSSKSGSTGSPGTTGSTDGSPGGTGETGGTDTGAGLDDSGEDGTTSLPEGIHTDWAAGSTALLAANYAVDFGDDGCAQDCELTLGPCYAETLERKDISEGEEGLPTRVALRVVDLDCVPVAGAVVDIWHCAASGLYSGDDAQDMCTERDADALAGRWFRGTQTTNADGVVEFDTCMPGAYPSRAVHIHFQVRVGGTAFVTSQLCFDDTLLTDVFDVHPHYATFGQPQTSNAADSIFGGDLDRYQFAWRQAEDGALVVWKTLTIRRDIAEATC